jgi:hypothetical protein
MITRLDEGVIPKIATYIGCDHFSIDAIAIYEEHDEKTSGGSPRGTDISRLLAWYFIVVKSR